MRYLDTWWSPVAQCYRVEDGEMFTYYNLAGVVGHFRNRERPAGAQLGRVDSPRMRDLLRALNAARILVEYVEETRG